MAIYNILFNNLFIIPSFKIYNGYKVSAIIELYQLLEILLLKNWFKISYSFSTSGQSRPLSLKSSETNDLESSISMIPF